MVSRMRRRAQPLAARRTPSRDQRSECAGPGGGGNRVGEHNGGMSRLLDDDEITRQLTDLPGWSREGDALVASVEAPDFPAAIALVDAVAADAEATNHHPDIDIRWRTTHWRLSTHSEGGVTQLDVELAHRIADAAHGLGGRFLT